MREEGRPVSMDLSQHSLAELRARLESELSPALERRLLDALARDRRRGAQQLAERMRRRAARRRAEAQRLARLFDRRAVLWAAGALRVAGVDEVGVGPLAGPVVAAAVVLPERVDLPGLDDSKRVSRTARERLARAIREQALEVSVAAVEPEEIDRINVLRASLVAMRRAVCALRQAPDHLLVDARTIPGVPMPQTGLVGGDAIDGSIAAASIVAKVHRDALMRALDARHPGYGFAEHKGYGTPSHLAALERLGPSPVHRRSFAPVARRTSV